MGRHDLSETPNSYVTAVALDKDLLSELSVGLEPFKIQIHRFNSLIDAQSNWLSANSNGHVVLINQKSIDHETPPILTRIFNNERVKVILFGENPSSDQLISAIRNKVFDYFIHPASIPDAVNSIISAISAIQNSKNMQLQLSELESKSLHLILNRYDSLLYLINECSARNIPATASNLTTMVPFSLPTVHRIGTALNNDKMIEIHRSPTDKRVRLYKVSEHGKHYLNRVLKNKI
ncbi:MAG: MarR family winged helix-turn-helix transcriptional regulator [Thalassobaculum sp.]|uniref:MarR family winged helix-turn-helix transcriptional regulator n=1 Tax=Thalassobaculum sp. TaxID=2022740 RepID=UPI0032EDCC9E